ncbi:MAG: hypothetical protein HGA85_07395 [Nanoarchaeota archaeon]|nr:hypothetical protein [Nanoarchaeota archaeon]
MDSAEIYVGALLYQNDVDKIFGEGLVDLEEGDGEGIEEILSQHALIKDTGLQLKYLSECFPNGPGELHKTPEECVVVLGINVLTMETGYRSTVYHLNDLVDQIPKAMKQVTDIFKRLNIGRDVNVYGIAFEGY